MKVEMLLKAKNIVDETIAPNKEVGEDKECYCVLEEFHNETHILVNWQIIFFKFNMDRWSTNILNRSFWIYKQVLVERIEKKYWGETFFRDQ